MAEPRKHPVDDGCPWCGADLFVDPDAVAEGQCLECHACHGIALVEGVSRSDVFFCRVDVAPLRAGVDAAPVLVALATRVRELERKLAETRRDLRYRDA